MNKMKLGGTENKKTRILLGIARFLFWMLLTRLCVFSSLHGDQLVFQSGSSFRVTFFLIPYLILGALYGYVFAYASFLISFIITVIFSMNTAYNMAIYLVATTCFAIFAQYFWFRTKKKTALAALITLFLTSVMEFACETVLQTEIYSVETFFSFGRYITGDATIIFLTAFLLHLFLTKAPDLCKSLFLTGIGYTDAFRNNTELQRRLRKTRISVKITCIIIGTEVILGIAVAMFMIALFPDMKDIMINNYRRNAGGEETYETVSEIGEVAESTEKHETITDDVFIQRMENLRFAFGSSVVVYDIKMILLMLCVGVPIGGFANFYTKTAIGGPLGNLSDFMKDFAEADDDKKREVATKVDQMKWRSRDEIGIVFEASRSMVHSIGDYILRLQEEQKLQTELEVARKASEAKSSFLSNMSHEIRTPINAVLGMNEMILREASDPQIEEYAQNVKSAGNSLLGIVNDILDFSKIEAGKMDILPVEYHLSSMVNDLVNMISVKAEDKGLKVEVEVDPGTPDKLIGDEIRIKQCVTNVLTNAVKYTETGTVTLHVGFREGEEDNIFLKFRVVDTGIGIKEEDLNKLFSPFERIEEIRNRTIEGTGLGMSITKKLLAMMDTKLEVKSVYGEGSDFSFEVKQQLANGSIAIGDFKEKYKIYLKSLKKYHESFRAPTAKILVVDDTPMNLTVVKGLLKSTQVQVDTAESGKETLTKAAKERYDVLFIDHRMPEMDGLETLAALKTSEENLNKDVPCIALTANAGPKAKEEYLDAGFDDYLAKPVSGPDLENMLMRYLPAEKILEADPAKAIGSEGKETAEPSVSLLMRNMPGIDAGEALKNCGSAEILENVLKDFWISIEKKANDIEAFAEAEDYRNFTVAVHALKSSARLIGAMQLSADAAYLEQCGNEENKEQIREKTPALLTAYRALREILAPLCEEEKRDDLPEISEKEFLGALGDMKELLEAYDFDTADNIMAMLSEYRIPETHREKYEKIKELMAAVDRDALLELLQ